MIMTPATLLVLAAHCGPAVAPTTLAAVVRAESGLDPFAIGVNAPARMQLSAASAAEAAATARRMLAAGDDVDLGLAQINGRNLPRLGLSVEAAFDPCRNLAAAARLLRSGYALARPAVVGAQAALRIALSYYNTGRPDRGFANGYVARVTGDRAPPRGSMPTAMAAPGGWAVFAAPPAPRTSPPFVLEPQALGDAR